MKDFRKNEQGLYICEECGNTFACKENVSKHIKHHNISTNEYYNKWCKEPGDGICNECGKEISIKQKYCSIKCRLIGAGKKTSYTAKEKRIKIKEKFKFICLECNEKFETSIKFHNHIIKMHGLHFYYDKFLIKENEGICKVCGEETKFTGKLQGRFSGYMICCSKKCANKYRFQKRSKTNLEKHGVVNVYQREDVKANIKQAFIKHYGVDNNMKSEEGKLAYSKSIQNKYGVDWPLQNKTILEKGQKTAKTLKQFNEKIWYQGTYELDFLKRYYEKYSDMQRGPSIRYGKNKVYHPDFYIPSLNLIIEIKSTWTLDAYEEKQKKKATIANGFKYLMILDKNYDTFEYFI